MLNALKWLKAINVILCAAWSISGGYNLSPTQKELTTYEKIKILKPQGSNLVAAKIGQSIDVYCSAHQHDLVLSIIFVESSFRVSAVSSTGDIGLSQFSPELALLHGLQPERLLRDTDYTIKHTCKILAKKKRWWHWHSKTPSKYKVWKAKVKKAIEKIQETR